MMKTEEWLHLKSTSKKIFGVNWIVSSSPYGRVEWRAGGFEKRRKTIWKKEDINDAMKLQHDEAYP